MADTSNVFMKRRNPSWLNQYYATSGKVPSAGVIQEMVAGELDAAAQNRYRSKSLANQQLQLDYMGRSLRNQEKTAKAGAIGDIFNAGTGALTAGAALYKSLKGDGTTTETKPTGTGFLDGITGFAKNLFSDNKTGTGMNYNPDFQDSYFFENQEMPDYTGLGLTGNENFVLPTKGKNLFGDDDYGGFDGYDFFGDIASMFGFTA